MLPPLPSAGLLLLLLALFLWRELRHAEPVLQPRFFTRRAFAAATAGVGLSNLAMYCTLLVLPLLLVRLGWRSVETGLLLAAMAGVTVLVAPFGGRLADRLGRRWPTVVGLGLQTLGFLIVSLGSAGLTITLPALIAGLALGGAGLGLSQAGLQTSALEAVERRHAGVASGTYSTCRYLGSIVGASLLAGLLGPSRDAAGFGAVFTMIVLSAGLATVAAVGLRDHPSSER
jgi:DHA2 family methylenomycin A resistance protein-like MFS transporter